MEKTAVEWLFDNLKSHFKHDGDLFESVCMSYAIAKQKEKQQIIDAYNNGLSNWDNTDDYDGSKYYNETFNK